MVGRRAGDHAANDPGHESGRRVAFAHSHLHVAAQLGIQFRVPVHHRIQFSCARPLSRLCSRLRSHLP